MNTNSKSMTRLGAVVETLPNHRWAAIGKGLLASGLLDKHMFEQQWDSESRSTLFSNVLNSVGNPSRPSWKQLVKVLQVQLGYDHELTTLVKEVTRDCDQVRERSHSYGTQFRGGKEYHPDSGEETNNPSTPLLPNSQGHSCYRQNSLNWIKVSCMFIAIAVMCLTAAGLILIVELCQPTFKAVLAYGGDTVLVDTVNTFWYSKWTANECLHIGDYYHTTSLYLVSQDTLATYEYDRTIKSRVFQQPLPSRRTGMINKNMYLLDGSSIDYDICVTSEAEQERKGELYVFDNLDNFNAYLDEVSSSTQLSVYHKQLQIGAKNITSCTHLHFLVRRPSHYFVTANGPGNIMYAYNATIHTVSFNHSQYSEHCRILDTFQCDVDIPSKLFEANTYSLLGYVHPQQITDPPSTHICASTHRSSTFLFVVATLAALIGIAIVIVIFVVVCSCICSQKGKHSYRKITPVEVHIQ